MDLNEAARARAQALGGTPETGSTGYFGSMANYEERGSKSNPGAVILPTGSTPKGGTPAPRTQAT